MYILFDTQTAVIDLKAAGFEDSQAQAIVAVIKNAHVELATKRDLNEAVAELKSDIVLLDRTISLKLTGLYAFIALVAVGVAKLVFVP